MNDLKKKDDGIYKDKIKELQNTIGKDKLDKKMKEIESKYGDRLNDYVNKVQNFSKSATNEEKAKMIMDMKNKLSADDQKKFDKAISVFKKYMNNI